MLLNKCKTGDHIGLCKHCKIASIYRLYGIFSRFLDCSAFPFFVNWDQAPHWGKKRKKSAYAKKINERGEPTGSLGREKVAVAPPVPPSPAHPSAPFASRHIFFLFYSVFCLFPHFGASSRTNFLLKL